MNTDLTKSGSFAGRITWMLNADDSARRAILFANDEAMGTGFSLALRLALL